MFLPYPWRGLLPAGAKVSVNVTESEAYTALALVPGQQQNAIGVEANAPPPFNDLVTGDAADGLLIGAISSPIALTNVVIVQQLVDFPPPSAGVITLAANTVYKINGPIDCGSNRFLLGVGTLVQGFSSAARDRLTSTAAGALFTDTGSEEFFVSDLTLTASGALFDIQGSPSLMVLSSIVSDAGDLGTLGGARISLTNCVFEGFDSGFDFSAGGVWVELIATHFGQIASPTAGAKCVDFGSNAWTSFIRLADCDFVSGSGGFAISGLPGNGNLAPGAGDIGLAEVNNCAFAGTGTNLENITINDLRWSFRGLLGQQNSAVLGSLEITTPAATTNPGVGVFAKAAGTTAITVSARFDPTPGVSNRLTFLGITPLPLRIDITGTLSKDSGGASVLYEIAIFKNGAQLGTATTNVDANNRGEPFSLTQVDPSGSANDFYEVYAANVENGIDGFVLDELSMVVSAFPTGS